MTSGDDPRISAYVLNELSEDERKAFEAEFRVNSDLWHEVEEMQVAADQLKNGLREHSAPVVLSDRRRAAIEDYMLRRTRSAQSWPRKRTALVVTGSIAAMLLCALTLWSIRSAQRDDQAAKRRSAAMLLARLGDALKQYQSDFGALPPDTGYGLAMADPSKGAGRTYDAGSLWRYLGCSSTRNGVSHGPYLNFNSSELAEYNDPVHGRSYYVVDSWGTPVGYVGNPIRVIHNRGGFDLFSAGPDRKTGQDVIPNAAANLAYDGIDNDGDGVVDNSAELGGAALNGCLTVANADVNIERESLDDLNNWDQQY